MVASPVVTKCPPSTGLERSAGFLAASVFSLVYYFAPLYVLTAPVALVVGCLVYGRWAATLLYLGPSFLSAVLPSRRNKWALESWLLRQAPKYFDYTEVIEFGDEELLEYIAKRPVVAVVSPHGVLSYVGISSGLVGKEFGAPLRGRVIEKLPTAVASVVLSFPILKHVIGIFGLLDASKKSLTRRIAKGGSFVLYPGGIAELFLSSPDEECILARKGFVKLALSTGADIIPIYCFGNTTVLRVFKHPVLSKVSRAMGASLTFFWGRWGLPLPLPDKLIYVRGRPLGLPKIEGEPTQAQIDEWHGKYVAELTRIFEAYKSMRPDFKGKTLIVKSGDEKKEEKKTK